ncbi:hypothetical protein CBW65_06735 [Tumebacillus avium]|uniref:Carrier domain-containing protein n=1 Tax=Tumebacillus avium TaxID=1903704 RepID=A0A1Y0IJZ1_9BACL|nr:non-ribosomal peptide synthetase [Tumebacillus avium]ARU60822.1 hypothetical protein CBW65_06735 [Tumebacillus avium]
MQRPVALTHPQKRIWYLEKINPNTAMHNIGGTLRVRASLDYELLAEAVRHLQRQQQSLRIRLVEEHGDAAQSAVEGAEQEIPFFDFSREEDPEAAYQRWLEEEFARPFELAGGLLCHFATFRLSAAEGGVLAKFHHLIADGWSIKVAVEGVLANYTRLQQGEPAADETHAYTDFLEREQAYLQSERCQKDRAYWTELFADLDGLAHLRKSAADTAGSRLAFDLEGAASEAIRAFCEQARCSYNTFFTALMLIYLNRTTGQEDLVLGVPVLNRSGQKEKAILGMFTSTMPFRAQVPDAGTFLEFLRAVDKQLRNCLLHQRYPYDLLAQDLELKRNGYDSLFQVCVNYYNNSFRNDFGGSKAELYEMYSGHQTYALQLVVKEWSDSGQITLAYDYKLADYTAEQIAQMHRHLLGLALQVANQPQEEVGRLQLLTEQELQEIAAWNDTAAPYPKEQTIAELFAQQAARTPDRIAVCDGERTLTYRELDEQANSLAHTLRQKGVGPSVLVGLLAEHSPEMLVGLFAVLKAGGAYVPLDPESPVERNQTILADAAPELVLSNCRERLPLHWPGEWIDLQEAANYAPDSTAPEKPSGPHDPVYVIFTSGSTGKPKGTVIEQQGLVNYVWWAKRAYIRHEDEAFALYSSLAFDLTVTSIFTPLLSGNPVLIYRDDQPEFVLYRLLRENRTQILKLTPAHLALLQDFDASGSVLKRLIVGGEALKTSVARQAEELFAGVEIYNEYGPTEAVVGCMIHRFDAEADRGADVPIGRPIANAGIHILDRQMQPQPPGAAGELYISGDGLARGYLNRPDLTAERFVTAPGSSTRLYRTGDRAKRSANGDIEYLGRLDHQVKINGYRIELGEIESLLLAHPGVQEAAVLDLEQEDGRRFLCAYVAADPGIAPLQLRQHLSRSLPSAVIPAQFVAVERLPLTRNGKIDRAALPTPASITPAGQAAAQDVSQLQQEVLAIYRRVLGAPDMGLDDLFYSMGGDSIKAIQIAAKLPELGYTVKVKDLLGCETVRELSALLEQHAASHFADQSLRTGEVGITPIQSWFGDQNFAAPGYYNQSLFLTLKQRVERQEIERALHALVVRHDALRLTVAPATGALFYNELHATPHLSVAVTNLSGLTQEGQHKLIGEQALASKSSFDLSADLLLAACLFERSDAPQQLLLTAHHLVVDGVSWRILLGDFVTALEHIRAGQPVELPPKTHGMQEWAEALAAYARQDSLLQETPYWEQALQPVRPFPVDFDHGEHLVEHSNTIGVALPADVTSLLLSAANDPYSTKPHELIIAALAAALGTFSGGDAVLLELEGHGREELGELDLSRTVGWFTTMFPVRLPVHGGDTREQIRAVKETLRRVPHNGFGYGVLRHLTDELQAAHQPPQPIRFNYLGDFDASFDNEWLAWSGGADETSESAPQNALTALLDINAYVAKGQLHMAVTYSRHHFQDATAERLLAGIREELQKVLDHCTKKGDDVEFTPSDFELAELSQDLLDDLFS